MPESELTFDVDTEFPFLLVRLQTHIFGFSLSIIGMFPFLLVRLQTIGKVSSAT